MKKHLYLKNLFFLILITLTLSNCNYKEVEIGEIEEIKLKETGIKKIPLTIKIQVNNPNNYKIKVTSYNIKLSIKEIDFATAEDDSKIVIPAKYKGTIPIAFTLKPNIRGIFSIKSLILIAEIFKKKSIKINASGYFKIKVFLFSKKIHINEKRTIKLTGNQ